MAFEAKELSLMAYTGAGSGSQLWFYENSGEDTASTSGFFNAATEDLRKGDLIYDVGNTTFLAVTSDTGAGTVTTADLLD